jgi:Fur family ferric uptake transcriptional regulator
MRFGEKDITGILRRRGYRLTRQRRAVIRAIAASADHLTPAAIYEKASRSQASIGLVTVYRTLEVLSRLGLICELHAGDSCPSYTICIPEHHHHLICSACGRVFDFTGHDLTDLERMLAEESGFEIEGHLLEFVGRCRTCQQAS